MTFGGCIVIESDGNVKNHEFIELYQIPSILLEMIGFYDSHYFLSHCTPRRLWNSITFIRGSSKGEHGGGFFGENVTFPGFP